MDACLLREVQQLKLRALLLDQQPRFPLGLETMTLIGQAQVTCPLKGCTESEEGGSEVRRPWVFLPPGGRRWGT